ncbi:serine/threonine-protein kinase HAL4/sat4 [Entophlyctis luteolus]|nr:serine/threonine-protein kinase HAL4/sat4 [Entophlyctis luteolus]
MSSFDVGVWSPALDKTARTSTAAVPTSVSASAPAAVHQAYGVSAAPGDEPTDQSHSSSTAKGTMYRIFRQHSDATAAAPAAGHSGVLSNGLFGRSRKAFATRANSGDASDWDSGSDNSLFDSGTEAETDTDSHVDSDGSLRHLSDGRRSVASQNAPSSPNGTLERTANKSNQAPVLSRPGQSSLPRLTNSVFKKNKEHKGADSESDSDFETASSMLRRPSKMSLSTLLKKQESSPTAPTNAASAKEPSSKEGSTASIFKSIMSGGKRKPSANSSSGTNLANGSSEIFEPPPSYSQSNSSSLAHLNHDPGLVPQMTRTGSESSLSEKYGPSVQTELGRGASAIVKLCSPVNSDRRFAVKEFNPRRKGEDQKAYIKKVTAEFCISSSLVHENVVRTVDLIQDDDRRKWNLVMEYSEGGDLFSKIKANVLTEPEIIDWQLINGVAYLHSEGVAHRDLKPENLLLDKSGQILKITDFGVSKVFRLPLETGKKKCVGECGSGPYVAPEVFLPKEYEPDMSDIWSMAVIYYVMAHNAIPWRAAKSSDPRFKNFLDHLGNFWPIERMQPPNKKKLMYRLMEPDPSKRINSKDLKDHEWVVSIACCHVGKPASHSHKACAV